MTLLYKKNYTVCPLLLGIFFTCLSCLLFCCSGECIQEVNLGLIGKWGYSGAIYCIEKSENSPYAYCGTEDGLLIVDVSDPNAPYKVSLLSFGKVNALQSFSSSYGSGKFIMLVIFNDQRIIIGNEERTDQKKELIILDTNDPKQPVFIGRYPFLESPRDVRIVGDYAYLADGENGLVIVNISDPSKPSYRGGYHTQGNALGIDLLGHYAYIADGGNGLVIIDVSNPLEPVYTGKYNSAASHLTFARDVAVSGKYAYLANGDNGLIIVDCTDRANPVMTSSYQTATFAQSLALSGSQIFVCEWSNQQNSFNGIEIVDATNPSAPFKGGEYPTTGYAWGIDISGRHAYLADQEMGMLILDISEAFHPLYKGGETSGEAWGVAVSTHYAYITGRERGLAIIDITDQNAPLFTAKYDTAGMAYDVAIDGNVTYIADGGNGLVVLDTTNPNFPFSIGQYKKEGGKGEALGIAIREHYAYIAYGSEGLIIVDVSNPSIPAFLWQYKNGNDRSIASDVKISPDGSYVYVAYGIEGFAVIDITTPVSPALKNSYKTGFPVWNVQSLAISASGQYLYAGDIYNGFLVFGLTDPVNPFLAGRYEIEGMIQDIALYDHYCLLAAGENGLTLVDVTDSSHPSFSGHEDTQGRAHSIVISGGYAYCGDVNNGLLIFKIINTVSPQGNLILCPSGPASITNALWTPCAGLANLAYSIFQDHGYPHYSIYYLNPDPYQDIDGDSFSDPFVVDDFDPTVLDIKYALTEWASGRLNNGPLYLYLPGQGTIDAYQIYPREILLASLPDDPNRRDDLKHGLDTFQHKTGRDVVCILEFLASGSFCNNLIDPNTSPYARTIITCTDTGLSCLDPEGNFTFTSLFLKHLKESTQEGLFSDTGISSEERIDLLEGIFSRSRGIFWNPDNSIPDPFKTQPPQMITASGSHTLWGITLSIDQQNSLFDQNIQTPTLTESNHFLHLKAIGQYLDGNIPLNGLVYYHSSDPSILLVTQDGDVYPNPNTNYNGKTFIQATIIDPFFTQSPDHAHNLPPLGGVTGRIGMEVAIAGKKGKDYLPKAIIVAGRSNDLTGYDYLWESTNQLANYAYTTFIERGYSPANVYYMSHHPEQPGVDGPHNKENFSSILQQIFMNPNNPYLNLEGVADLTLFLIDHGKKGTFILGPGDDQFISPYTLNNWLDGLQGKYPDAKITVIIEACYSGTFVAPLITEGNNRIIITSTQENVAYIAANGWVSFTYFLLNYLRGGDNFIDAFEKSFTDISLLSWGSIQHPVLQENLPLHNPDQKRLGDSFILSQGQPQILQVSKFDDPNTPILPKIPVTLWAKAEDLDSIENVWAMISNSQGNSHFSAPSDISGITADIPKIDLHYTPINDRYEGVYTTGFPTSGPYTIIFMAKDTTGMESYPTPVYINVTGGHKDYALLASDTNSITYLQFAQWVLEKRRIAQEDIQIESLNGLSSRLQNIIDNPPSSLRYLLLCCITQDTPDAIDPNSLSQQMNQIQQKTGCTIISIMDADESGRFLPFLNGERRALITSTDSSHKSNLGHIGQPFSQFFFSSIYNGVNIEQAYYSARLAIGYYSSQNPLLDDNGNGTTPDYGLNYDGKFSKEIYPGSPYEPVTAGPRLTLPEYIQIHDWNTKTAAIWAEVEEPDPNSRAWALIISPQGSYNAIELPYTITHNRFEADFYAGDPNDPAIGQGIYRVVVYFQEPEGLLDYDETYLLWPDTCEKDDDPDQAKAIMVNTSPQAHNFHTTDDEDWAFFYGYAGIPYEVKAVKGWTDCQLLIEIFDPNGAQIAYADPYAVGFAPLVNGFYFVRIQYTCQTLPSAYPSYYLSIVCPSAGTGGIWGWVKDADNLAGIVNAEICSVAGQCVTSMSEWEDPQSQIPYIEAGFFFMDALRIVAGGLTVTAQAEGYTPMSTIVTGYDENLVKVIFYLHAQATPPVQTVSQEELINTVRYMQGKDDELKIEIPLSEGLNLFSHPSAAKNSINAADQFLWTYETGFDPQTGPLYFHGIRQYDLTCYFRQSHGYWSTDYSGGNFFTVASGESNLIYMLKEKTLEFSIPFPNPGIDLHEGINHVGIPFPPNDYSSYIMLKELGTPNDVVSISHFDPLQGKWECTQWEFNKPGGKNFPIRSGEGYLVCMKNARSVWYPNKPTP